MALPKMDENARAAALEKAAAVRRERAQVKADLKAGKTTLADLVKASKDNPVLARTRVREVLTALPGVGAAKRDKAMASLGIQETRRLGGLGEHQAAALVSWFSDK